MPQVKIEILYDPKAEHLESVFADILASCERARKVDVLPETAPAEIPGQLSLEEVKTLEQPHETSTPVKECQKVKEEPIPSLTDIRATATALSKKNKAALKAIFESFGAAKLSDVSEDNYSELMRKMVEANA